MTTTLEMPVFREYRELSYLLPAAFFPSPWRLS